MVSETPALSDCGWVALDQMRRQGVVYDGHLVTKMGRTELVKLGLAARREGFNRLTHRGLHIAIRMSLDCWQTRTGATQ